MEGIVRSTTIAITIRHLRQILIDILLTQKSKILVRHLPNPLFLLAGHVGSLGCRTQLLEVEVEAAFHG